MTVEPAAVPSRFRLVEPEPRDARVMEADHRIANSLALVCSMIRLQARELADRGEMVSPKAAARLLDESALRIEAIARWHRLLARQDGESHVDLGGYLREICESAIQSLAPPGSVRLVTDLEDGCIVAAGKVAPLALLVSEAVTNAIKYAHPAEVGGLITVACRRGRDGRLHLTIADDGVGLPDGFDPMKDGGLGLKVMRTLARQLDAKLLFHSTSLGLCIALSAPFSAPDA